MLPFLKWELGDILILLRVVRVTESSLISPTMQGFKLGIISSHLVFVLLNPQSTLF